MSVGSRHHKLWMTQAQTLPTDCYRLLKTSLRTFSLHIPPKKAKKNAQNLNQMAKPSVYFMQIYIFFIFVSMWIKQRLVVQMENELGASKTSGYQWEIWRSQTKQGGVEEVWNCCTTRGSTWLMKRTWPDTRTKLMSWPVHATPWRHISDLRRPRFWRRTGSARQLNRKSQKWQSPEDSAVFVRIFRQ